MFYGSVEVVVLREGVSGLFHTVTQGPRLVQAPPSRISTVTEKEMTGEVSYQLFYASV